ncbi:MarR family transcriptional regulator [Radiobacillus kanasensis]|uniref:MarR family winged helix-turn-helix transcriptional regulator n=1 Tax=Radiobacillus kanasensis TaxID=2844358 RepID=UPI001E46735E|nr:MarR family transcriptional regulator [Radiobacillus kanasensis]UFU00711.1 MarR family transcriptional regulator [Radiobacillus kanasensis]
MKKNSLLHMEIKQLSDLISQLFSDEIRNLVKDEEFVRLSSKQLMLLDLLYQKPLTMNEIAEAFQMTASAASQLVKKLEADNYVKREINLENRREIHVLLDTKGKHYNQKLEEMEMYILDKYYGKLENEDLIQLKDILGKLYHIAVEEQ